MSAGSFDISYMNKCHGGGVTSDVRSVFVQMVTPPHKQIPQWHQCPRDYRIGGWIFSSPQRQREFLRNTEFPQKTTFKVWYCTSMPMSLIHVTWIWYTVITDLCLMCNAEAFALMNWNLLSWIQWQKWDTSLPLAFRSL